MSDQISEIDFPDEGREAELDRMLHGDGLPEEFPPLVPSITDRGLLLMAIQLPVSNLGYANGWADTPLLLEKCKHTHDSRKVGRCRTEYSCAICNFKFTVDSGD